MSIYARVIYLSLIHICVQVQLNLFHTSWKCKEKSHSCSQNVNSYQPKSQQYISLVVQKIGFSRARLTNFRVRRNRVREVMQAREKHLRCLLYTSFWIQCAKRQCSSDRSRKLGRTRQKRISRGIKGTVWGRSEWRLEMSQQTKIRISSVRSLCWLSVVSEQVSGGDL